ncbi:hypothetical protein, partial [Stenotrophomonas maltophilia group sp. CASM10]|uniref:hypothetical protein n=1 Tax=Stenotrophomonas maltophilia group sp. CASM10 TaxID=3111513 RepID=UPI003BF86DA8
MSQFAHQQTAHLAQAQLDLDAAIDARTVKGVGVLFVLSVSSTASPNLQMTISQTTFQKRNFPTSICYGDTP